MQPTLYYYTQSVNIFGYGATTTGGSSTTSTWSRPSDWLQMPNTSSMTGSVGSFTGLFAVYSGSNYTNFVALSAAAISGSTATSYSVNWGDGTATQSYANNIQANYSYSYANTAASSYSSGSGGSYAPGGSGGYGYRQVLINVVPSGSSNLTAVNLQLKNTITSSAQWLDIAVGGSNITSLTIGGATSTLASLQRANIVNFSSSLTTFTSLFYGCNSLQSVPLFNTQNGTIFTSMFQYCTSLQSVPLFNTQNGTGFSAMFGYCYSLQSVPLFNTISGSNFSTMFDYCTSLQSVPLFNTQNATLPMNLMFANCTSLQAIPLLNVTNNALTASGVFANIFAASSPNLKIGALSGSRSTLNYTGCSLSYDAIQEIYAYLGNTGSVACSITTSGNYGSSSLTAGDIAVATNKGWKVFP